MKGKYRKDIQKRREPRSHSQTDHEWGKKGTRKPTTTAMQKEKNPRKSKHKNSLAGATSRKKGNNR